MQDVDGLLCNQLSNVPDDDLLAELLVCAHCHQEAAVRAERSQLQQTCEFGNQLIQKVVIKFGGKCVAMTVQSENMHQS